MAKKNSGRSRQLKQMAERRKAAAAGKGWLPVVAGSRWKLAIVTPTPAIDPGEVYEFVIVEDERGVARALEMCFRPAGAADLVKGLETAMRRPEKPSTPGQPVEVVVASEEAATALAPTAQGHGMALLVDEGLTVGQAFLKLAERTGHTLSSSAPFGVPPSRERALAEAGDALADLQPWEEFADDLTFEIDRPDKPLEFRFAVVMGAYNEEIGVALYRSLEDIEHMRIPDGAPEQYVDLRAAFFSWPEELDGEQVELWQHRGYPERSGMYMNGGTIDAAGQLGELDEAGADDLYTALAALTALVTELDVDDDGEWPERASVEVDGKPVTITLHVPEDEPGFAGSSAPLVSDAAVRFHLLPKGAEGLPPDLAGDENSALVVEGTTEDLLTAAERLRDKERYFVLPSDARPVLVARADDGLEFACELPPAIGAELGRMAEKGLAIVLLLMSARTNPLDEAIDLRQALLVLPLLPESPEVLRMAGMIAGRMGDAPAPLPFGADSPFGPDERFVFEVSVDNIEPRIWRRFALPAEGTFGDLHECIQDVAAWDRSHLFDFRTGAGRNARTLASIGDDGEFGWDDDESPDAYETPLFSYFEDRRKRKCTYRYDFGDDWRVTVQLFKVETKPGAGFEFIDGARAFPPEDCGGTPGYANLLAAMADADPEHGWADFLEGFDPESFDAEGLKAMFAGYNRQ